MKNTQKKKCETLFWNFAESKSTHETILSTQILYEDERKISLMTFNCRKTLSAVWDIN